MAVLSKERVGLDVAYMAVGEGGMHKVAPLCGGAGEVERWDETGE